MSENNGIALWLVVAGGVFIASIATALMVAPLIAKKSEHPIRFAFWGSGVMGAISVVTYCVLVWTFRDDLNRLVRGMPFFMLVATCAMALIFISSIGRVLYVRFWTNLAKRMAEPKSDDKHIK